MNLQDYANSLEQEVLAIYHGQDNTFVEEVLTDVIVSRLTEHGEADGHVVCSYRRPGAGGQPRAKISGWQLAEDGSNLDLFVTHRVEPGSPVSPSVIKEQGQLALGFFSRAVRGGYSAIEESTPEFDAMKRVFDEQEVITSVRVFVLTNGRVSKAVHLADKETAGVDFKFHMWDVEKLLRLETSGQGREPIVVNFVEDYGGSLPCMVSEDAGGEYRSMLAFLPGALLARIYSQYGPRLIEQNVRTFLQAKGKINRGIQTTIREEPSRFLAYNNGLSATAEHVDLEISGSHGYRIRSVTELQVVNGAQTMGSIVHALRKEKRDVSAVTVMLKLTVPNRTADMRGFVAKISDFANSQNAIRQADLTANHPFHVAFEKMSNSVFVPARGTLLQTRWFYERARGSYLFAKAELDGAPRRVFEDCFPLNQKFNKTDLAKYENSWNQRPWLVSKGAEKNFVEYMTELTDRGFPAVDQEYFKRAIAKAILFRTTERIVSEQKFAGYRANIVAYTVAYLSWQSRMRFDLGRVWEEQGVSLATKEALGSISRAVKEVIIDGGGGQNITEWCKKEACWDSVKRLNVFAIETLTSEFVGDERRPSEPISDIEHSSVGKAMAFPASFWFGLAAWATTVNKFKPQERKFITQLGGMALAAQRVSPKQAKWALSLVEEAERLGYSGD